LVSDRPPWSGHEFLDAAGNEPIWIKARLKLLEVCTNATLSILKALLMRLTKKVLAWNTASTISNPEALKGDVGGTSDPNSAEPRRR
jgi:hypothetical protein